MICNKPYEVLENTGFTIWWCNYPKGHTGPCGMIYNLYTDGEEIDEPHTIQTDEEQYSTEEDSDGEGN
jgi:hypothetical protein